VTFLAQISWLKKLFSFEKIKKIDKNGKNRVFSTKYNILSKYFAPKQVPFDSPLLKTGIHA